MDLNAFDTVEACEAGAEIVILHPGTAKPTDVKITVCGPDSRRYQEAANDILRRSLKRRTPMTPEHRIADEIDLLARVTIGWSGLTENGTQIQFSVDAARDVYSRFPAIKRQVDGFIGDIRNFFQD